MDFLIRLPRAVVALPIWAGCHCPVGATPHAYSPEITRHARAPPKLCRICDKVSEGHVRGGVSPASMRAALPQRGNGIQPRLGGQRLPWGGESKNPSSSTGLELVSVLPACSRD